MHYYGHALNLACSDAIKGCKITKEALDSAYELIKLIKFSPKQHAIFDKIKDELAPGTAGIKVFVKLDGQCVVRVLAESLPIIPFCKLLLNSAKI